MREFCFSAGSARNCGSAICCGFSTSPAIFKRHVFVSPYHEEPIAALVDRIGASQVLFGSDWPHAEGLAEPRDFAESIAHLPPDDLRKVMRDNARELLTPS